MPRETVQFPRVDGTVSTETSVRWSREDQGGHVQICVQRHPWEQPQCPNGCDGETMRCSDCPPKGRLVEGGAVPLLPPAPEGTPEVVKVISDSMGLVGTVVQDVLGAAAGLFGDLAATESDGSVTMWTDPLTRDELNKLIRVLRRARDQAYGEDA